MIKDTFKILAALFAFAAAIAPLLSCESSDTSVDLSSMYITEIKDGDLYKYNVTTGTETPVCDDPLCDHSDETCKFSGVSRIIMHGDDLYYIKDGGITEENGEHQLIQYICAYNYSTGAFTELYQTTDGNQEGISYRFDYDGGYLYFYKKVLENGNTRADLYRIYIKTKKTEELFVGDDVFKAVIGDRLYYVDTGKGIYSLDTGGGDKKYILEDPNIYMIKPSASDGGYLYYSLQKGSGETVKYSLYRLNIKTGESALVTENAPLSLYYGISESGGVLYIENVAVNPAMAYTDSDGHEYFNTTGGIIYAYNLKSEQTSTFYSDEALDISSIQCVGKYLIIQYNKQEENAYLVNAGILVLPL